MALKPQIIKYKFQIRKLRFRKNEEYPNSTTLVELKQDSDVLASSPAGSFLPLHASVVGDLLWGGFGQFFL